jgi:spore maturation protein CgeB
MQGFAPMKIYGLESVDIPTVYYGIDTHMVRDVIFEEAKNYKHVFFAQKKAIPDFKEFCGKESHWLPCCAEPLNHKPMNFEPEYDFAFVGGIDLSEAHKHRRDAIKKLKEKYKVFVGNAYGYFMTMQYNKAKVVFNYAVNDDVNMRVFEAMACKRPLLTNKLSVESGLNELFVDGTHLMTFTDEDLMEKAEILIKDKGLRDKIALAGYNEVVNNHTYEKRMEEIWQTIKTKI